MLTNSHRRAVSVLLAASLALAGCGSTDDSDTAADAGDRAVDTDATATTDQLAFTDGSDADQVTETTPTSEAGDSSSADSSSSLDTSSGRPPVTLIAGSRGGDPDGIYRGTIATMTLNGPVVPASAPAPERVPAGEHPLTGLPGTSADRPAAVVKIDNGTAAAPHTGLNAADIVIEEEVEGGVTRLAAIFHSHSAIVGPVRSGRTTDVTLISSLGTPVLIYSGANDITEEILLSFDHIQNHSYSRSSGYWREDGRKAPSNLFTDTGPHWATATGGAPAAQFAYRSGGEGVGGVAADEVRIDYGANRAVWNWKTDASTVAGGQWFRTQRGSEHLLTSGDQVSAANVIVVKAERVATGMTDAAGGDVPEFPFVGTGDATVYTAGKRIDGTWTRPTLGSVAVLTNADGEVIELTPGRTWIQLIDAEGGATK